MKTRKITFNDRVTIVEHDGQWGFSYKDNTVDWIGPTAPFIVARGFSRLLGWFS